MGNFPTDLTVCVLLKLHNNSNNGQKEEGAGMQD